MRISALLLSLALSLPAAAAETPWQEVAPGVKLRLISSDLRAEDGTTLVGLELDMPSTSNTYWRIPGETGIPTELDFSGSRGVAGHEVLWPYPRIETATGYVDYVYRGPTVLPVRLRLGDADADATLGVTMGVCSDICVPVTARFALPLGFAAPDRAQALRLQQALALVPLPWDGPGAPVRAVGYDAAARALTVQLDEGSIDPLSIIADASAAGQLFGAPQKSPDGKLVLLPLLGGEVDADTEGKPVLLTFMTDMGPFTIERRIASAASTGAGE